MSSAVSFARMVRVLALAIPCLVPFVAGCDLESYPAEMTYPQRSDPLVTSPPGSDSWNTIAPGQLDRHIASLTAIGGKTFDPHALDPKDQQQLAEALRALFGTPAAPTVAIKEDDQANSDFVRDLKLDKDTLAKGSKVYRRHCMHCHGVTGDGRGPTAPWVNPTPRDYRQGLFKFMSTTVSVTGPKPRREDLRRTLEHGIEGTSMPSFSSLEEDEKEALVSYVIHLSLRGETEYATMLPLLNKSGLNDMSVKEKVEDLLTNSDDGLLKTWARSNAEGIEPDAYPYKEGDKEQLAGSIRRGYKLFIDTKSSAGCLNCHLDFGRQVPFKYDKWGTLVRPSNLTAGVYRGGRRPIDLYWRIRRGIDPSQMPRAEFEVKKDQVSDKGDPYWDLVNFVQALPYPRMLPEDIAKDIYGPREKAVEHARR